MIVLKMILQVIVNLGLAVLVFRIRNGACTGTGLIALVIAVAIGEFTLGYIGGKNER
mgnify:CR=1 FL=1